MALLIIAVPFLFKCLIICLKALCLKYNKLKVTLEIYMLKELKKYTIAKSGEHIATIKAESIAMCKKRLMELKYTEQDIILFDYQVSNDSQIIDFQKNFNVDIYPVKFYQISNNTLFFIKKLYDQIGRATFLLVKTEPNKALMIDVGLTSYIDKNELIYLVKVVNNETLNYA